MNGPIRTWVNPAPAEPAAVDAAPSQFADKAAQPTPREERVLVDHCLTGDRAAWDQLFKKWHQPLLGMTRILLGPSADDNLVEEIVGRVWYSLVAESGRRLDRYDPDRGCSLTTFLAGFARNEIRQHFRSENRRRVREMTASREELQSQPLTFSKMGSQLDEFLKNLTPRENEFFRVCLLNGVGPEAATFSDTNAWQLTHRIRRKLRAFLELSSEREDRDPAERDANKS